MSTQVWEGTSRTLAVVNPTNPSQVAVGQFCTVAISNDFGRTFPITRTANPCTNFGGGISLAYDSQGRLFVAYLAEQGADNEFTVMAGQSTNTTTPGGGDFNGVAVSADDGSNDDKEWIAADYNPASPFRDNLYIVWTDLGASDIKFRAPSTRPRPGRPPTRSQPAVRGSRGRAMSRSGRTGTCTSRITPMPAPGPMEMPPARRSVLAGWIWRGELRRRDGAAEERGLRPRRRDLDCNVRGPRERFRAWTSG